MSGAATALPRRAPTPSWTSRVSPAHLTIGLGLLAIAIRLIGLTSRPLWLDEAYSLYAIEQSWHGLWSIVPGYETHPPFYYSILKLWGSLFGTGQGALRGLSVLCSAGTVLVTIAAALELERQDPTGRPRLRTGIAGLLAACSPMLVFLDQQARPYSLMVLAYAISVLAVLRLMREFKDGGAGSLASWALLTAATGLTLWSHNLGALYALCLGLALAPSWLARPLGPARLRRGLAAAACVVLLYLPCLAIAARQLGGWNSSWLAWDPTKLAHLISFYSIPVEALTVGAALGMLVMFLLAKRAFGHAIASRHWDANGALILMWLGPPLLVAAISALILPIFLERTLAATLVPAYLALAGAAARSKSAPERVIFSAILGLSLVPAAVQTASRPPSERWDEVAAYLDRVVAPADQLWVYPNDSILPLRHADPNAAYKPRQLPAPFPALAFKGVNRSGSPAAPSLTRKQARAVAADPAMRAVPTIWLVTRQSAIFDPDNDLPNALMRDRRAGKPQRWGYIEVQPFTRR